MFLTSKELKKSFKEAYREIFTPSLTLLGYSRKRDIFHKLINNKIVIALSYKYYHPNEFTIQFDVYPLCNGDEFEVFMDGSYETDLILCEKGQWVFELGVDSAFISQQVHTAMNCVQLNVLPILSCITDYKSCYTTMRQLDKRGGLYNSPRIPNCDIMRYGDLLLAIGEYDLALKAKEAILYQNRVIGNIQPTHHFYYEYLERVEEYNHLKDLIEGKYFDEIKKIISERESFSLASYREKYLGKKTTV